MRFDRYAVLADEDVWPAAIAGAELRDQLKYSHQPLARSLDPEAFAALLRRPVRAAEDAKPLAGPLLAMRNPDVDAFASLDSGILYPHPSGLPRVSPYYDPSALRVPWLHAMGTLDTTQQPHSDAKSLFDEAVHSNRYRLIVAGMGHVDFTTYALIEGRREMPNYWAAATPEVAVRSPWVQRRGTKRDRPKPEHEADFGLRPACAIAMPRFVLECGSGILRVLVRSWPSLLPDCSRSSLSEAAKSSV
jgi:fermentation-respiration switch protein FrsA (DUF1100 family)